MSYIERIWNTQQGLEDRFRRVGRGRFGRVLRLARKPTYDEFVKRSWIVGLGIGLVGLSCFIVYYTCLKVPPKITVLPGHKD